MTSPLNTIQELVPRDRFYPWRVLVVCALLNRTHGRQVRPMIDSFFERWPTPEDLMKESPEVMAEAVRSLGFYNRRTLTLRNMTRDVIDGKPLDACFGCGKYAIDSIDLFVVGRTDVKPNDTWLKPYLEWRLAGGPPVEWDVQGWLDWRKRDRT